MNRERPNLLVFVTPMMDLLVFVHSILNEIAGLHVQFQTEFLVLAFSFRGRFWFLALGFRWNFWFLAFSFRQGFWFWHSVSD